jgi:predicted histone-like DNA-binding protein
MAGYILQALPEELTDGKKVLYPKMHTYNLQDYEALLKKMHSYAGAFSEGMIKGVFDTLILTMTSWMPEGHSIKIDGLGVFSLSLGFDTDTPSEHEYAKSEKKAKNPKEKYRHVCIKSINFKPDPQLLKAMNEQAEFTRLEKVVKTPRKNPYTREERLAIAKEIIEQKGVMTFTEYVNATGLCRSSASADLKQLTADPQSGIAEQGSRSYKVWVKKER